MKVQISYVDLFKSLHGGVRIVMCKLPILCLHKLVNSQKDYYLGVKSYSCGLLRFYLSSKVNFKISGISLIKMKMRKNKIFVNKLNMMVVSFGSPLRQCWQQ